MKADIYLRTSTAEQHPEKQEQECLEFAKRKGYEVNDIHLEKLSGYKQIEREKYNQVKENARQGKIQAVIVWALDRWVRNRDTLLEDVTTLRNYDVKLHSVKESWLEAINIDGSLGRTIQDFLLGLIGSLAEMESKRKSERVIMAYKNRKGSWGRKPLKNVDKQIIGLFEQDKPIRQISKEVYYWDKSRNKKFVSVGYVHKIISKFKQDNKSFEGNS